MARVLLIDDDRDFGEFMRDALEQNGHVVDYLDTATGGLETLDSSQYEVILLDNKMPRLSGIELLAALCATGVERPNHPDDGRSDLRNGDSGHEPGGI